MKIYPEAFEVIKELGDKFKSGEFEGRVADNGINLALLASMVANTGDGNHIEIGTLFGASAITVGLMKRKLGLKGDLYLIDPFDEDARKKDIRLTNKNGQEGDQSLLVATPEQLENNMALFDLEYTLVQEYSDPWPEQLNDLTFATAYVDGDHLHDTPYKDYLNLRGRVESYIGFDNYEEGYPDVMGGVNKAISEGEDWVLFYKNSTFAVLRRRLPGRGIGNSPITAL